MRSITFEEADILVAFNVHRKDSDGSLIIFWKLIKEFEKPFFLYQTDEDLTKQIELLIKESGFENIIFEVKDGIIISKNKGKEQSDFSKIINTNRLRFRGVQYAPTQ